MLITSATITVARTKETQIIEKTKINPDSIQRSEYSILGDWAKGHNMELHGGTQTYRYGWEDEPQGYVPGEDLYNCLSIDSNYCRGHNAGHVFRTYLDLYPLRIGFDEPKTITGIDHIEYTTIDFPGDYAHFIFKTTAIFKLEGEVVDTIVNACNNNYNHPTSFVLSNPTEVDEIQLIWSVGWSSGHRDFDVGVNVNYVEFSLEPPTWPDGDINQDGCVNYQDLQLLRQAWLSVPGDDNWDERCDLNGDGRVNFLDLQILRNHWLECI